ncbi:hypothetical protein MMC25_005759 [Agyrium rufum]|nr:hypothetical protein [Agyrium rufum]
MPPSTSSILTSLSTLRISAHQIPAYNLIPNTSIQQKPLLIYHSAFLSSPSSPSSSSPSPSSSSPSPSSSSPSPSSSSPSPSSTSSLPPPLSAAKIQSHLRHINIVHPQWLYTMYSTTHFHSTTHEVLCVSRGSARLCFGGETNPGRIETTVRKGDMMIIPAGVGHRLLEDLGGEDEKGEGKGEGEGESFEMVGAYPVGREWDMCYGREGGGEEEKVKGIARLGWFEVDPVYGEGGPVTRY